MHKSQSDPEDKRWMLEEEAVERIREFDACNEHTARETLRKLKADFPGIVRVM